MKHFNNIKKSIFLLLIGCTCIIPFACNGDEDEIQGAVSGFVRDERGNELYNVEVTISPGGKVTATGNDGRYEFIDLKPQQYAIKAEKTGYQSDVKTINVINDQSERCDITLKDGTGYLTIDEKELNFGKNNDILAFTIRNKGQTEIEWKISNTYDWIKKVEPALGTIRAGGSTSVSVTIDRSQLQSGKTKENSLVITSDSGADYIVIKATGDDGKGSGTDPGGSNQPNLSAGLIAHYTFDNENADDATRNENHGNIVNESKFDPDTPNGKGKSIFLNGSKEQFVNIPRDLLKGLYKYSFSFWIKEFDPGVLLAGVSSRGLDYCSPRLIAGQDGQFYFYTTYSRNNSFSFKYNLIQDNKWHMITLVSEYVFYPYTEYADFENKLYVDGKLMDIQQDHTPAKIQNTASNIQIGGTCNGLYTSAGSMSIDEVRFYNRCLTDSDVKYLYQQELE